MSIQLTEHLESNPPNNNPEQIQKKLEQIWSELLLVDEIALDSDFFALGGNSILVLKAVAKMTKVFNIEIPHNILFIHPTFFNLCEWLSEKTTVKSKLISVITAQHSQSKIPLSFAQQRMWFLNQALHGKYIYNIPLVLLLRGPLNQSVLKKALDSLFARHQSLRASIRENNGVPELIINNEELIVKTLDLSHLSPDAKEKSFLEIANNEVREPFNLTEGPMIRITLINLEQEKTAFILNAHHIILDGWSIEIFCKELSIYYNAYLKDELPHLPDLTIQYGDFTLWQRDWLQGDVLEKNLSYWETKLKGAPELNFPKDNKNLGLPTQQKGACSSFISPDILDKLHKISQKENVTLFMSLLTAFKILLFHYTSQKDIVIGTPFSNRHYPGIEGVIGFFVNILPLRTKLDESMSFTELLPRVRGVVADAYENQDLPFEKLVNHLKLPRDINKNALFQIVLGFHKGRDNSQLTLDGIQNELIVLESGFSHFDINFNIYEEGGLHFVCDYDKDLFEESRIKRMLDHFKILLKEIINKPDQPIHSLFFLTQKEKQEILQTWNDTNVDYPNDQGIHELFTEQAKKTPHHVAIDYTASLGA